MPRTYPPKRTRTEQIEAAIAARQCDADEVLRRTDLPRVARTLAHQVRRAAEVDKRQLTLRSGETDHPVAGAFAERILLDLAARYGVPDA